MFKSLGSLFAKYQALFCSAKFRFLGELSPTIWPFSHHLNREFQTRAACRLLKSFARFPLCFLLCIFHSHKQRELVPEHLILPDELPPPPSAYKGHNSLVCSKFNPAFLIRSPAARGSMVHAVARDLCPDLFDGIRYNDSGITLGRIAGVQRRLARLFERFRR